MAPELFLKKAYDNKIDVFAFGNVLYELWERALPFDGIYVDCM
jgi:serine/threonine protein kinase